MEGTDLAARLERKFSLGDKPLLRKALYERLERIVEEEGEYAYQIIATCVADADGRRKPGNYFAFVVMRRLIERKVVRVAEF